MKLYELTQAYAQVADMLETDTDQQAIIDTLESLEADITDKAENIARLIKNIDGDIAILKSEETRLNDKRKALENRKDGLKQYLAKQLTIAKLDKVKGNVFTVAMQKNAPSLDMVDEAAFKEAVISEGLYEKYYIEQAPKLDRTTLLDDLKQGAAFPGATVVQSKSLRIR